MNSCKQCQESNPLEFYKSNKTLCKNCIKKRARKYREENIEKVKAYDRNRPNHKERVENNSKRVKAMKDENPEKYKKVIIEPKARWVGQNKEKRKAHGAINNKLRAVNIKSDLCQLCGKTNTAIEGHHFDYSRPLDVTWLCKRCHGLAHRAMNEDKRIA